MARGVPLSPEQRAEIAEKMRETIGTPEGSVRKLAALFGVGPTSIRRIRDEFGLRSADEARAMTEKAAQQTKISNADRRAALAKRLLQVAEHALDDMAEPTIVFSFGGRDNTYAEHELLEPDFAGRQKLMTIAAIALDKHLVIEKHDSEASAASDFELFQRWIAGGGATE